ncbi:VacJ family lipoprotein [Acinetobacter guillouiae]|uniref:MlaA family lipoprotein n=1 Tax=Acinetobacter guillouiae TaxID=106649 RepID=UPI003AF99762
MRPYHVLWACLLSIGLTSHVFAQDELSTQENSDNAVSTDSVSDDKSSQENSSTLENEATSKHPRIEALKELKNITKNDLKVNANAAQPDAVKDPLQPLNREIYAFNDMIDRNVARPIAVQYKEKVPGDVRSSYSLFRKNLSEPWNAVNQLAQGRFSRAAKSLGRFTINTVTSLGLADPATRLGLATEEESLGTTLGYYGIPSGPYVMLPILGPSTLRHSADYVAEGYANPLTYPMDNNHQTGLIWGNRTLGGINTRSKLLDVESVLQGDRYSAIRDIYLQRLAFQIAEKKGRGQEAVAFVDDDEDDNNSPADTNADK